MPHKKLNKEIELILLEKIKKIEEDRKIGLRARMFIEIEKESSLFDKIKGSIEENNTFFINKSYHCYVHLSNENLIQIGFYKN